MIRKLITLLVCLSFLVSVSGTCLAEQIFLITETELTTLEQNSALLRSKIEKLESILTTSQQDLSVTQQQLDEYRTQLVQYQKDLLDLQTQLKVLKVESDTAKANLEASNKSLTKTTQYLNQYEAAAQSQIKKLTIERNLGWLAFLIKVLHK